jgi:ferric-dicitrate binding protein FerR (iron transport regulator)
VVEPPSLVVGAVVVLVGAAVSVPAPLVQAAAMRAAQQPATSERRILIDGSSITIDQRPPGQHTTGAHP